MKRMLSRQLNLVYSQINLLETNCEAKRTNNLSYFHGKIHERRNQSPVRIKTEPKTTKTKDLSDYSGHFRLEKRLACAAGGNIMPGYCFFAAERPRVSGKAARESPACVSGKAARESPPCLISYDFSMPLTFVSLVKTVRLTNQGKSLVPKPYCRANNSYRRVSGHVSFLAAQMLYE